MILYVILYLILHILLCVFILLTAGARLIRIRPAAFPMMVFVPVFGPVSLLLLGIFKRLKKDGSADIEVDRFRVEFEIYRSLGMQDDSDKDVVTLEEAMILNNNQVRRNLILDLMKEHVVPLEEALSLSPSDVRRKLMMDILTSDTSSFYALMEQARMNDDVEVVHYATTAMTELNKKYDVTLQKYRENHRSNPDDIQVLSLYCDCLEQYLGLGLVKGQIEKTRRQELIECLEKLVKSTPTLERYEELIRQYLLLERFPEADAALNEMEKNWPMSENYWVLRVEYHVRRKDSAALRKTLRSAASNGVYLSSKAKEKITFWSRKSANIK